MIKKYIRGNKKRGKEVIAELEKLGGVNKNNAFKGTSDGCLYFIDKNNRITNCFQESDTADLILEYFEEIKLPGEKQKLKVIRGNIKRGREVIELLESMGGHNSKNLCGAGTNVYYFINDDGSIGYRANIKGGFFDDYELEVLKLPEKKQKLKVIKGDKNRGYEVIKFLENLGGFNKSCCSGKNEAFYYFIGNESCIDCYAIEDDFFNDFELEIIELPKKKTTLKVIKGNKERGDEIIKLLESMGGKDELSYSCEFNTNYYFVNNEGYIECHTIDDDFFNDYELEIMELPKKQKYIFKPFDKVLVRDENNEVWRCGIFSHINDVGCKDTFVCINSSWKCCIPYEGNEHLLGTTDNPE